MSAYQIPFIGGVEGITFAGKKYLSVGGAIDLLQECADGKFSLEQMLTELRRVFELPRESSTGSQK